ncbi:MAG: hypothetical protein C4341_08375 [Armatimonadota bacterium]
MSKVSAYVWVVCGVVLMGVTWAGFWWLKIGPERGEVAAYREVNAKLDEIISQPSREQARDRVAKALEAVNAAQIEWKRIAETKTPSRGRFNLLDHRWQLTVNARQWHSGVEADLKRWIGRSGVRVLSPTNEAGEVGPFVPYPTDNANELVESYFNYPALPYPVAIWDLGTITVEGTYEQIVRHVRSWNDIPGYIASVRGLSITGTNNRLRGTYNLIVIAYINTDNVAGGTGEGGRVPDISPRGQQQGTGGTGASGTAPRPGGQTRSGGGAAGAGGGGGGGGNTTAEAGLPGQ